jgi:hypothetical protein
MGHAKKERYDIRLRARGFDRLLTNLDKGPDGTLRGVAYGPTLLNAPYVRQGPVVRLVQYSERATEQRWRSVSRTVEKLNRERKTDVRLPERVVFVSSFSLLSANPEEMFVTPVPVNLEEPIRRTLFGPSDAAGRFF